MIVAIVQARTGSSRLPNKVLMEFCGKPDLYHVYSRVSKSHMVDKVIIATTDKAEDDIIEDYCKLNEFNFFRGSEEDVLDRYYKCCLKYNIKYEDVIIRITADCPVIDPQIIDQVVSYYVKNDFDYVSNAIEPTFPNGLDLEVFSLKALEQAYNRANLLSEREHVTPYIKKHPEQFKLSNFKYEKDLSHHRWTLDEKEDYELLKVIFDNLYYENEHFTFMDILAFVDNNTEVSKINAMYKRNEGYIKSLQNDRKVVI